MRSVKDIISDFVKVREQRRALEKKAQELKDGPEAQLEQEIILALNAGGMKSVNFPDIGMVTVKNSYHYEIADNAKLMLCMLASMTKALKEHRDVQDAVLLQSRVSKSALEALVGEDASEDKLALLGVRRAEKSTVSITKR